MSALAKVLCVDDEPNILSAFRRQLRDRFQIEVQSSPEEALEQIKKGERFAVIVSDMRMPGMNGTTFLKAVRELCPDSVRVMLTGNVDQDTAAQAVNEGKIFRFLNKPCNSDQLATVIDEALEQHRLITAERDLLQNTLSGSIKVLTDILALSDPVAFGAGSRLRQPVREICTALEITNPWEIELAAMLSVIGWVSVPEQVKQRFRSGEKLSPTELELVSTITATGSTLIKPIPRLQGVAKIILYSSKNYDGSGLPDDNIAAEQIPLASRILRLTQAIIDLELKGFSRTDALKKLEQLPDLVDVKLVSRLLNSSKELSTKTPTSFVIEPRELCVGQRLTADIICSDGRLLLTAGTFISELLRKSILNYSETLGLRTPISVDTRIPTARSNSKGG